MNPNIFQSLTVLGTDEIREILAKRIDQQKQAVGIVVGVIEPTGRRVVAYGNPAKGDPRTVDGDTIFEIGSITKVFTSLLLADMVNRKEVALDDPAAKYLPENVKMPERSGKSITLLDLSTHSSGLPPLPGILSRRTHAIFTPTTAWTICISSCPATRCRATPVPKSNIQTWARASSATSSRTAPERIMRAWSEAASRDRSACRTRVLRSLPPWWLTTRSPLKLAPRAEPRA
jgi:hypothetical protein